MKSSLGLLLLALVVPGHTRQWPTASGTPAACIPTEHMPIYGLHSRPPEPMPIVRPDSTWFDRTPTTAITPCYLVDSLRVDKAPGSRPQPRGPIGTWPWPSPTTDSSGR